MSLERVVVIVGAGAVVNSWKPVRRALLRTYHYIPEGEENLAFANMVFGLRWLHQVHFDDPKFERFRNERKAAYDELKRNIAIELVAAAGGGEIHLSADFAAIRDRFLSGVTEATYVTTNWDDALDAHAEGVIHLHGSMQDAAALYLTSEGIEEPYRGEDRALLGNAAGKAISALEAADAVIIWGLSLSPLDAELGVVLAESLQPRQPGVIIDLHPEIPARRLQYYDPRMRIEMFDPRYLNGGKLFEP
jgi:hypothetical protein